MGSRTFTMIKPNAVALGYTGKILDMIIEAGFRIRAMKMVCMSRNDAENFYAAHRGKPFFDHLILFMTSGPVIVAVLEGENAVGRFRELVGPTDPKNAPEGTIRNKFGESLTRNSIHASDSDENARLEWGGFFTDSEIMVTDYWLPIAAEEIDSM